jgi:hypothetical protein
MDYETVTLFDARGREWGIELLDDEVYLFCPDSPSEGAEYFHTTNEALRWLDDEGHMTHPY